MLPKVFAAALLGLVAAGIPTPARALDPERRITQYVLETWTREDGLPQRTVQAILQTRDGYLWIGTGSGLVRFDGVRFEAYRTGDVPELRTDNVKALLEAEDGSLWVGLFGGGLARYRAGVFEVFGEEAGLPSLLVRALAPGPDGSIWVGMQSGGAARFRDGRVVETIGTAQGLRSEYVRALLATRSGDLWIGTERGGLSRLREGRLQTLSVDQGMLSNVVLDLHEDASGEIWAATSWGVNRIRGDRIVGYGLAEGLSSDYVFSIGEDGDGNIWIGTGGGGVNRFDGERFAALGTEDGLPADYIWAIEEDREGNLWIGGEGGLAKLRNGKVLVWSEREGLPSSTVRGLRERSDGAMLFATPAGLAVLGADGAVTKVERGRGMPDAPLWTVLESAQGDLWVGGEGGLVQLRSGRAVKHALPGAIDTTFWSLLQDRSGAIWAGSQYAGLYRYAGGSWTRLVRSDGLGGDLVRVLFEDSRGDLWAGTEGGGLSRLREGRVAETFTREDGLRSDSILALHEDAEGLLWVGTSGGGVSLFDGTRFATATRKEGFVADSVAAIAEDELGFLWLSTSRGISRVARTELIALLRGETDSLDSFTIGQPDGLPRGGDIGAGFTPSIWKARDGKIWFPTTAGAVVVDPAHLAANPVPPQVVVERLLANHEAVPIAGSIELAPGTFDLEVHYTATSLTAPDQVRFRYRLAEIEHDWVDAGARRVAFYTNLPPGGYVFEVMAANEDGVWSEAATALPFRLLPRFYQTVWFRALMVALALCALYGAYRLRVAHLEARAAVAEERNRLAREIHDTIAQDLAAILMQARAAQGAAANDDAVATRLAKIGGLAESSLEEARRSLRALRPRALEDRSLAAALRETATELDPGPDTHIEVRAHERGKLSPVLEAELLRIGREAVQNAVRHAGAKRIDVELEIGRREALLRVRDDGRGFASTPEGGAVSSSGRFGLVGMRERAERLGGRLDVASTPGAGTEIAARVPLRRAAR